MATLGGIFSLIVSGIVVGLINEPEDRARVIRVGRSPFARGLKLESPNYQRCAGKRKE
jgi:hypothetical protein